MRFLRVFRLGLEFSAFRRDVPGTVALRDDFTYFLNRHVGKNNRVCSHISNEADIALVAEFDALIQFLGNSHGPLSRETELSRGFLLQSRCRKWCCGIAPPLLLVDIYRGQLSRRRVGDCSLHLACSGFVLEAKLLYLFAFISYESRQESLARLTHFGFDRPVFACLERLDFKFALDDHSQRGALHSSRGESTLNFFPKQR